MDRLRYACVLLIKPGYQGSVRVGFAPPNNFVEAEIDLDSDSVELKINNQFNSFSVEELNTFILSSIFCL